MANYNYVRWHTRPNATTTEQLYRALKPFVEAYEKARDPVDDSDLYNEQPRSVSVTLGDCRRAASVMRKVEEGAK
jgi:hypothetical protein